MVLVIVDTREPPEIAKRIEELLSDAIVVVKQLEIGDIHFGSLTVERKTAQDFINSWFSGRLQNQICNMVAAMKTKRPLIGVHLDGSENVAADDWSRLTKHVRTINFAVPTFAFQTFDELVFFLADAYSHLRKGEWFDYVKRPVRVIEGSALPAAAVYAGLPGIGNELAVRMAEVYPSPSDLTDAIRGQSKLEETGKKRKPWYDAVEGIGRQKGKAVTAAWLGIPDHDESGVPRDAKKEELKP